MKTRTILLPALALVAASANAASFYGDFSTTTNADTDANPWLYGTSDAAGGAITPFTGYKTTGDNGVSRWSNADEIALVPAAFYSPLVGGGSSHTVAPGTAALHGGFNGEIAAAAYTIPTTGTYRINGTFGAGDSGAVDLYLYAGSENLLTTLNTFDAEGFDFTRTLTAGSLVYFGVGTAGNFGSDTTPLDATITQAVPEPGTWAALGLGGLGLLRRRKRA